ncbi:Panacea domain-containing protein [Bradyrhizobium guangxiense]
MPYDVRSVANYVLETAQRLDITVTNISVNKIVYFLHAWFLAKTGQPLVTAKIEAWDYGPVFRELYMQFKPFGAGRITVLATRRNPSTAKEEVCPVGIKREDEEFLLPLLLRYLQMTPASLVRLSHESGGPWDQVYNHSGESNPGMRISDEAIQQYFRCQTRH